jgi:CheY-like chemotaxis protein
MSEERLKLLCVDDEPRVVHALERHLRERYEVLTATSGTAGLDILAENKDLAIVISDMRMPEMDGAVFLRHVHNVRPNVVRILLTGHADIQSAIKAINQGQVFRFLTKPCPPEELFAVMAEAERQYQLIMAEKHLLQHTLVGCIKALADVMSLTNPEVMGRAVRLKRRVGAIAKELRLERRWQVEAAAMFSQLGSLSLPASTVRKLAGAEPLGEPERRNADSAARAANRLIARVPRLEPVGRLLDLALGLEPSDSADEAERKPAELLRLAIDLDSLEFNGTRADAALQDIRGQKTYSDEMLEAADRVLARSRDTVQCASVPLEQLRVGMVLDQDLHTQRGVLIAPRGCEVTSSFLEHIRQFVQQIERTSVAVLETSASEELLPMARGT